MIPCPICRAESRLESSFTDVHLYRCRECDHCFTDQVRLEKFEEYTAEYYEVHHKNWNLYPDYCLFQAIHRELQTLGKNAAMLDAGCGKGALLKYLNKLEPGFKLTGLDMSSNPPSPGILFLQGDFLSFEMNKEFDGVTSLAVIEHVTDVNIFVEKLKRLCRPGGKVIVMTLDDRSIIYEAARFLNKVGVKAPFERLYSRHHLHHFNTSSLRRLMENHGLVVEKTIHHNNRLSAVDFSESSFIKRLIFKVGVLGTFWVGSLFRKTLLQTIVCHKPGS